MFLEVVLRFDLTTNDFYNKHDLKERVKQQIDKIWQQDGMEIVGIHAEK